MSTINWEERQMIKNRTQVERKQGYPKTEFGKIGTGLKRLAEIK